MLESVRHLFIRKSVGSLAEAQETLGQEWLKFTVVGTIKLVWFPGVVEAISEFAKGLGKIR